MLGLQPPAQTLQVRACLLRGDALPKPAEGGERAVANRARQVGWSERQPDPGIGVGEAEALGEYADDGEATAIHHDGLRRPLRIRQIAPEILAHEDRGIRTAGGIESQAVSGPGRDGLDPGGAEPVGGDPGSAHREAGGARLHHDARGAKAGDHLEAVVLGPKARQLVARERRPVQIRGGRGVEDADCTPIAGVWCRAHPHFGGQREGDAADGERYRHGRNRERAPGRRRAQIARGAAGGDPQRVTVRAEATSNQARLLGKVEGAAGLEGGHPVPQLGVPFAAPIASGRLRHQPRRTGDHEGREAEHRSPRRGGGGHPIAGDGSPGPRRRRASAVTRRNASSRARAPAAVMV